jgi:hypothetical protein
MHKIAVAEHRSTGHIPAGTGSGGSRQIQKQFERRAGSINIKQRKRQRELVSPQRCVTSTMVFNTAVCTRIIVA